VTKDLGLEYEETHSSVKDSQSMNNSTVTIGIHFPNIFLNLFFTHHRCVTFCVIVTKDSEALSNRKCMYGACKQEWQPLSGKYALSVWGHRAFKWEICLERVKPQKKRHNGCVNRPGNNDAR
jgi:hypothetical protein